MEIQEKLLKYKYHILASLVISSGIVLLVFLAPSFLTILAYFWPLLVSTALFLVAVVVFGNSCSLQGDKVAGEGLLDYVAGEPDHHPVESLISSNEH